MDARELDNAYDWLRTLSHANPQPNMIDQASEEAVIRAWSHEFRGDHYIYYEAGKFKDLPNEMYIGIVASAELIGREPAETEDILLQGARSRINARKNVQAQMAELMGLPHSFRKDADDMAPAVRQSEADYLAHHSYFVERFHRQSGLEMEVIEDLGLSAFRNLPVEKPGDKFLYLVASNQINTDKGPKVPALRLDRLRQSWQYREIEPSLMSGFFLTKDEFKVKAIDGHLHWADIETAAIRELTTELSDVQTTTNTR